MKDDCFNERGVETADEFLQVPMRKPRSKSVSACSHVLFSPHVVFRSYNVCHHGYLSHFCEVQNHLQIEESLKIIVY